MKILNQSCAKLIIFYNALHSMHNLFVLWICSKHSCNIFYLEKNVLVKNMKNSHKLLNLWFYLTLNRACIILIFPKTENQSMFVKEIWFEMSDLSNVQQRKKMAIEPWLQIVVFDSAWGPVRALLILGIRYLKTRCFVLDSPCCWNNLPAGSVHDLTAQLCK